MAVNTEHALAGFLRTDDFTPQTWRFLRVDRSLASSVSCFKFGSLAVQQAAVIFFHFDLHNISIELIESNNKKSWFTHLSPELSMRHGSALFLVVDPRSIIGDPLKI